MAKLKLDLHAIYNDNKSIEQSLQSILQEAIEKKISLIEIIPGKGSGQLKKRVLKFFENPAIRNSFHRLEKDSKNFGRLFIHLKF